MNKPVDKTSFWRERLFRAIAFGKDLHTVIYDVDIKLWQKVQTETHNILAREMLRGNARNLLDVGCGYGALYDVIPDSYGLRYVGVDLSPELIEIALLRNPKVNFIAGDIRSVVNEQLKGCRFDAIVIRSFKDMIVGSLGLGAWEEIREAMSKLSRRLINIEYGSPDKPGEVTYTTEKL